MSNNGKNSGSIRKGTAPAARLGAVPSSFTYFPKKEKTGDFLISQAASRQVSSALESLTSVFGMGTGVSSLL